ncbi:MAG: hypothetical protein FDZ75_00670, partial [Actinobacteria bacterium]
MRPVLLDVWLFGLNVQLGAYTTLIVAGAVLGVVLTLVIARWRRLPLGRSAVVLGAAIVASFVGGRLLFVATQWPEIADEPQL